jgi:signal transduction histidine kinase
MPPPQPTCPPTPLTGRPADRHGAVLAVAALALGLGGGAAAARGLEQDARNDAGAVLDLRGIAVRDAVDASLQRYADTVHDLAAMAGTTMTDRLAATVPAVVGARLSGAHEVLVVNSDGSVAAAHAVDGSTAPQVRDLSAVDATLRTARELGRPVVSRGHVLSRDRVLPLRTRQTGFLMVAPVERSDGGFGGWVLVSARAGDLLDGALRSSGSTDSAVALVDTRDGSELAASTAVPAGTDARTLPVGPLEAGWRVVVRPTTADDSADDSAAADIALVAGILAGALAAGAVLARSADRRRGRSAIAEAHAATRRAEADTRRAEAALAVREAELAGFAVAAAEGLHAPLSSIAGFADLLVEEGRLDQESAGLLDRIRGSAQRGLTLVDELLVYATTDDAGLSLEPVDATLSTVAVVADAFDTLPLRPSVDIGDLPVVRADDVLLRQALVQLIDNATRYVRHGTGARVTVRARAGESGWWRIEVADRGIGVPEEHRDLIFLPFHRAPAADGYPGNGLGLATCKRIVAAHGGEIGVEPNPGGGSVFWFTLPDATGEDAGRLPFADAQIA